MRFVTRAASILYLIAPKENSEPTYCLAFQPRTAKLHLEPELDHDQDGHAAGKRWAKEAGHSGGTILE